MLNFALMSKFLKKHAVRISITLLIMVAAFFIGIMMSPSFGLIVAAASILVVQLLWFILARIHRLLDRLLPFEKSEAGRMFLQLLVGFIAGWIVTSIGMLVFLLHLPFSNVLGIPLMYSHYLSIIINIALIGQYFFQAWKNNAVKEERIKRENTQMQLQHLKNQIDPHFLFNAFTSLDNLTQTNPPLASEFIRHLSKIYRHALENKDNGVTPLAVELDMLRHYTALQKIRFGDALAIDIDINPSQEDRGVAALSLQMLIDNAIKHNEIHPDHPLYIRVYEEDGYIIVSNNKQIRRQLAISNKQGLQQLKQMYKLLGEKEVIVKDGDAKFTVSMPML